MGKDSVGIPRMPMHGWFCPGRRSRAHMAGGTTQRGAAQLAGTRPRRAGCQTLPYPEQPRAAGGRRRAPARPSPAACRPAPGAAARAAATAAAPPPAPPTPTAAARPRRRARRRPRRCLRPAAPPAPGRLPGLCPRARRPAVPPAHNRRGRAMRPPAGPGTRPPSQDERAPPRGSRAGHPLRAACICSAVSLTTFFQKKIAGDVLSTCSQPSADPLIDMLCTLPCATGADTILHSSAHAA